MKDYVFSKLEDPSKKVTIKAYNYADAVLKLALTYSDWEEYYPENNS